MLNVKVKYKYKHFQLNLSLFFYFTKILCFWKIKLQITFLLYVLFKINLYDMIDNIYKIFGHYKGTACNKDCYSVSKKVTHSLNNYIQVVKSVLLEITENHKI